MNQVLREQAIWAGFKQDPTDGNFYGDLGWQNEQICKLQQLVCIDLAKLLVERSLNHHEQCLLPQDVEALIKHWYQRYEIKHPS